MPMTDAFLVTIGNNGNQPRRADGVRP